MNDETKLSQLCSRRSFLRAGIGVAGASALSGCASKTFGRSFEAARFAWSGLGDVGVEKAAEAVPYASLSMRVGRSQTSLVVLGKVESLPAGGQRFHWYSSDQAVLVMCQGRIVQSAGFPSNIIRSELVTDDVFPLRPHQHLEAQPFAHAKWLIDLVPGPHFGEALVSDFFVESFEDLNLWAGPRKTVKVTERFTAHALDWSGVNHYWIDSSSLDVVRAQQQIVPNGPTITWEVMRPYA